MIETTFVNEIIKKIDQGFQWITITGKAGDGKTTAGYMVLDEMAWGDKVVVHLTDVDEYTIICQNTNDDVILLLDDVLGTFSLDVSSLDKWEPVIQAIKYNIGKSAEKGHSGYVTVLFISRWNVLQEGKKLLGKYNIFDTRAIVNMSDINENVTNERLQILNYHLERMDITDVSEDEKTELISNITSYGFPHTCKMYADLRAKYDVNITEFFSSPMQFLNEKTKDLIEDKRTEELFRLLLQREGRIDLNCIENKKFQQEVSPTVSALTGSFLTDNSGNITFSHPSVYETVGCIIGRKDIDLAIEKLSLSFLVQKMKFLGTSSEEAMYIYLRPTESNIEKLCDRFCSLLLQKQFAVLQHEFFEEMKFCQRLISSLCIQTRNWKRRVFFWKKETDKIHIDDEDWKGETLLHVAASCANLTALGVLMQRGADVNKRCNLHLDWNTNENRSTLEPQLFERRVPVWRANRHGLTPLHHLCGSERVNCDCLDLMIKHGADVNKVDLDGWTPLHCLCLNESADSIIFDLMIKSGSNVNKASRSGATPLHLLCQNTKTDESMLDVLVGYGADVNKGDKEGMTALQILCNHEKIDQSSMDILLKRGADVNKANKHGKTALHLLCQNPGADESNLVSIITHGAGVNNADEFAWTPLHIVCQRNDVVPSIIYLLIKHGADVNKSTGLGITPLHFLSQNEHADVNAMEVLIKHGADVNKADNFDVTPFHQLCARPGTDESSVDLMINHGADVNKSDEDGWTALHYLCQKDEPDGGIIDFVIKHGADVYKADEGGYTPLQHININPGSDQSIIDLMIKYGAEKA